MTDLSVHNYRPETVGKEVLASQIGVVERPISRWERIAGISWVRKTALLIAIGALWEIYARHLNNDLLIPTLTQTFSALAESLSSGSC